MTLEQIIKAFLNYTQEVKGRYGLSIRGGSLYSYNLKIAEHGGAGSYIVYDYMATGLRGMVSATTSKHVGMIKRAVPQNRLILM
tara:strand:- start:397 stop:648 length:252 start_codon:yes stop_codon:yes gene_type:complete